MSSAYSIPVLEAEGQCQRHADGERVPPARSLDPFTAVDLGDKTISAIVSRLRRAAPSNVPILLQGETGTGKEVFAHTVHLASKRNQRPFVAVNCASLPESLIESVLFGYCPGAFTGANSRGATGLVRQADKGTLFLDEIGDMPLCLQSRLLRVLAEGEITPLGSHTATRVDIRVLCATHRDLPALVRLGQFREDLLFRLRGLSVTLPPLRLRSDARTLIVHLLGLEAARTGHAVSIDEEAIALLLSLPWPGNIRELKQVLSTAISMCDGAVISASDIQESLHGIGACPSPSATPAPAGDSRESPALANDHSTCPPSSERDELLQLLRRHHWNISRAAQEAKSARTTIYRKMSRLQIVPPHLRDL